MNSGTDTGPESIVTEPDVHIIHVQIAWSLTYTNSLRDFVFLGHPTISDVASTPDDMLLYSERCGGLKPLAAYSCKDESASFDPHDYTQYPTTYCLKSPHLPYIKRDLNRRLCLTHDDPRIILDDNVYRLDKQYICDLIEFSQHAFDSFESWKSLGTRWDIETVPGLHDDILSLQAALQYEHTDISNIQQAVHNILRYSYEVSACRTLCFYRTLRVALGSCQLICGIDDFMVGTVLEHPFPPTSWAQELHANGVPLFCVRSEVWRRFDYSPDGHHRGSHETEHQNTLQALLHTSQIRTTRVHVPTQTQHPSDWRIMSSRDASEPPIEDVVFRTLKDATPFNVDHLSELKRILGERLKIYVPESNGPKVHEIPFVIDCTLLIYVPVAFKAFMQVHQCITSYICDKRATVRQP